MWTFYCQWQPLASVKNNSIQILIYKFNALRMNGLPSNLVVCCKTIYFNSLNKLNHLIIYTFHKNALFNILNNNL